MPLPPIGRAPGSEATEAGLLLASSGGLYKHSATPAIDNKHTIYFKNSKPRHSTGNCSAVIVSNFCKLASCCAGCGGGGAGAAQAAWRGLYRCPRRLLPPPPNIASKQPTGAAPARPGQPAMFVLARQGWPGVAWPCLRVYHWLPGGLGPPGLTGWRSKQPDTPGAPPTNTLPPILNT